jgi:carboxyl-terminal processing protease
MRALKLLWLAAAILLGGCAAVDPHNILSRGWRDADSPLRIDVLGAWGRTAAFDFVWETIDRKYVDPKFNGVDWKAAGARYRPLALGAASDDEFWEVLNRMAGELHDSHTRVEPPNLVALRRRQESVSIGLELNRVEGKIVVVWVAPDSDPYWAGVRAGMEVSQIDGRPAEERYHEVLAAEREQSTALAKERRAFRTLLLGEAGTKTPFEFVRSDGSKFRATLARKVVRIGPYASARLLPSGHAYIRFNSFSGSLLARVIGAIHEYESAPGLIIDLRNNGGGSAMMAEAIANQLLTRTTDIGTIVTRTGEPVTLFGFPLEKLKRTLEGSPSAYDKPVIVLINAGSASASELFAGWFQDIGRVKVVGQRSCGCLQGYLGYASVPGGAELAYSEIGMISSKGHRVEREGVIPDVEVPITRLDLQFGRDRVLEAAEELLRKNPPALATKG